MKISSYILLLACTILMPNLYSGFFSHGIYWNEGGNIKYADFNGNNVTTIQSGFSDVSDIHVDIAKQTLHFVNNGNLFKLDGNRNLHTINTHGYITNLTIAPSGNNFYYQSYPSEDTLHVYQQSLGNSNSRLLYSITSGMYSTAGPVNDFSFDSSNQQMLELGVSGGYRGESPFLIIRRRDLDGSRSYYDLGSTLASGPKANSFAYDESSGIFFLAETQAPIFENHLDRRGIWIFSENEGLSPLSLTDGIAVSDLALGSDYLYYATEDGIGYLDPNNPLTGLDPSSFIPALGASNLFVTNIPEPSTFAIGLGMIAFMTSIVIKQYARKTGSAGI